MKKQFGNIGHAAHLGGAMGGFVLTLFYNLNIVTHMLLIALGIPIILLFFGDKLRTYN